MMMDEIEVAAVWLLHKRNAKRKVNRKMWVHPINNARLGKGAFHVLSEEIKSDPNKFFNYYRMSATSFEALLNSIEIILTHDRTTAAHKLYIEECSDSILRVKDAIPLPRLDS